ncbi:hypothetical protein [Chitinophaga vietnamensis]|uniref:hypothetical protein n=1 Tax=Chitinophaga vietnamensis TaxID=2593957 RepID=UPI001177ABDB|nr:hypothetical protein [Chitinophaga vietnamensis]
MKSNICCVLLEYCGGKQTDALYTRLAKWNPGYKINVLDNASNQNKSRFITHQNMVNSGIGGGIIDALRIARKEQAKYLLLLVNDIVPITRIEIRNFELILAQYPEVVQLSASITKHSDQAAHYPWMIDQAQWQNRVVPHADILCCAMDIDFIQEFGGFPDSRSGWGYDLELAYQARIRQRKIVVSDFFKVRHVNDKTGATTSAEKRAELERVYDARYGSYKVIFEPINF